jgi:hypothetical protein
MASSNQQQLYNFQHQFHQNSQAGVGVSVIQEEDKESNENHKSLLMKNINAVNSSEEGNSGGSELVKHDKLKNHPF